MIFSKLLKKSSTIKARVELFMNKSTKSFIIQSRRKNVASGRAIILTISIIAVLGLFIPPNSSAIHNSDGITWQLVMISSYPACSGYHYQMMEH